MRKAGEREVRPNRLTYRVTAINSAPVHSVGFFQLTIYYAINSWPWINIWLYIILSQNYYFYIPVTVLYVRSHSITVNFLDIPMES